MAIFPHYLSKRKAQLSDIRLGIKVIEKGNQKQSLINSNEVEKYLFYILNQFQMLMFMGIGSEDFAWH